MARRFTRARLKAFVAALALASAGVASADLAEDARSAARVRDFARAAALWTQLADAGDHDAQYQLGSLYRAGRGVKQDAKQAFRWWLASAEGGDARSQFCVAGMYRDGWGTAPDRQAALRWFRAAAAQKHAGAIEKLGELERAPAEAPAAAARTTPAPATQRSRRRPRAAPEPVPAAERAADSAAWLSRSDGGADALGVAARRGETDIARGLIARGIAVDTRDDAGDTPLLAAARSDGWRIRTSAAAPVARTARS
jgi:TPR repeat protein